MDEQEQLARFHAEGREFAARHPDFNATLQSAEKRGLRLCDAATREAVKLGGLGVQTVYHLARPENESEARQLNVAEGEHVNDELIADRFRRIAARLDRHDTFKTITEKPDDVATHLEKRRQDIRSGKRRR